MSASGSSSVTAGSTSAGSSATGTSSTSTSASSSGGTSAGTGASAGSTGGGGTAGTTGGGGLDVPQTVEMMSGPGGTVLSAHLCQNLGFGGEAIAWSLSPGGLSVCPGGEPYVSFSLDTMSMERSLWAGTVLTPNFDGPPVSFETTTHGTITFDMAAMRDVVTPLPEAVTITVTTTDGGSIDFQFSGAQVTVSAFTPP